VRWALAIVWFLVACSTAEEPSPTDASAEEAGAPPDAVAPGEDAEPKRDFGVELDAEPALDRDAGLADLGGADACARPDCLLVEGERCEAHAACVSGRCECEGPDCRSRACAAAPCVCRYGPSCNRVLDDGTSDPEDCASGAACWGGLCLTPARDPGPPAPAAVIQSVSITARTGSGTNDGTDEAVRLCLTATRCFDLFQDGLNDLESGAIDVFHFDRAALPRSTIDRVELRMAPGTGAVDDWRARCVSVALDGVESYCVDPVPVQLGDEVGSVLTWRDPAGLHLGCRGCWDSALTHGPLLGGLEPNRARILVRTDSTRAVSVRLSGSSSTASPPAIAWARPEAGRDFTAVIDLAGLSPSTRYVYSVAVDGVVETLPQSFVTPPPRGTRGRLSFSFGSCTRPGFEETIFSHLSALRPDLFLFVGDNHYANSDLLQVLRFNYRWALSEPPRAAFVRAVPILAVWDDHDFVGNNTFGNVPGKGVARRAFSEYWANPGYGRGGAGIYFRHTQGDVDFFMLDDRFERDPIDGPVVFGDPDGRRSMLGADQTRWLLSELSTSTATFKLLVTGSQWTAFGSTDSWASYVPARDAIFDAIRDLGVEGVVLLSGDVHRAEFRRISRAAAMAYDLPELTSSPLANSNFACPAEAEIIACHDAAFYAIHVEIDTTLPNPTLSAVMYEHSSTTGTFTPLATWVIERSELEL
jgi:alkaline phosphatase D